MAIHKLTRNQEQFVTNVERAQFAGVTTKTSQAVRIALLSGLNYCNFDSGIASLTDEYLAGCMEYLYDKAVEANQQNNIKWLGIE